MKKIEVEIHTHTVASGHAYGTMREMAIVAKEKGIKAIGFTEHAPGIPGTCDPIYYLNLHVVPKTLYDVEVLHGSEVNVCNDGTLSLEDRFMKHLNYCIVGIHPICYENEGIEKNTENLISCMKHKKVYFVSHPDDSVTPLDYERVVQAAKKYHVALEINNTSIIKKDQRINCMENLRTILRLCMKYRANIFVGSDAHDPSMVGGHELALALIEAENFDEELIVNNDINKFKEFIAYEK